MKCGYCNQKLENINKNKQRLSNFQKLRTLTFWARFRASPTLTIAINNIASIST
jgi:hypothetical protein